MVMFRCLKKAKLRLQAEDRDEGERRQDRVVAQRVRSLVIEVRGVLVLDCGRVLADLLPPHFVVVGIEIRHADDVRGQGHDVEPIRRMLFGVGNRRAGALR